MKHFASILAILLAASTFVAGQDDDEPAPSPVDQYHIRQNADKQTSIILYLQKVLDNTDGATHLYQGNRFAAWRKRLLIRINTEGVTPQILAESEQLRDELNAELSKQSAVKPAASASSR